MATKHDIIMQYIESLPIGDKISVRKIAKKLNLSEGTAYRAIKDAEILGIVSTIERVGTIRIEKKVKYTPDMLTVGEVVKIIEGEVVGGEAGLNKHLSKFMIGAMTTDAMQRYFSEDSLIIVGNREDVQLFALEHGVAVLITGGFPASQQVIDLANRRRLPVISTNFDTFTVATIMNRTLADHLIKQEMITVQDIYTPLENAYVLSPSDTIQRFNQFEKLTGMSSFAVCYHNRLIGVVSAKDIQGRNDQLTIERVMTKQPITVNLHASIASASHKMLWDDIDMVPVVEDNLQLIGIVTRTEVTKAIQLVQQHPKVNQTIEEDILSSLIQLNPEDSPLGYQYKVNVQPPMINNFGTISFGVLSEMISGIAYRQVLAITHLNSIIEKIDLHYFKMIQLGNEIHFKVEVFNHNRRAALIQVDVFHENVLVAKAMIASQIIERG